MANTDMNAYLVTPRKNKDDFWNGIGKAFPFTTNDGRKGFKVPSLNLVIMEPKEGEPANEKSEENIPETAV